MNIDLEYYKKVATRVFNEDSPSGFTKNAIVVIDELLKEIGYQGKRTQKGNLVVDLEGIDNDYVVATSAHVDTLGLMVRSIKSNGYLAVTNIGGPIIPTLDGEYCKIVTRDNKKYSGTILSTSAAIHVYKDASSKTRDIDNIEVRIDEVVKNAKDVEGLGISNGDYVLIDPKFTLTKSGFIKSRFIDDKGSACCLLSILKYFKDNKIKPKNKTKFIFVVHEEVGHGASAISDDIKEFVTIDMGCVGLDLAGNEYAVSIAAKDSGGPYDYELTTRLINLAKDNKLSYVVDIFPYYGSDIGAAYRAGHDFKGALIGPGVHASHGMERTHLDAIRNTIELMILYLTK
ncbi:MAG: M42 family metallopeptidase [Erysipelotrichales bacterium]|nr:M42 family metallopeptidase [Erysipelotrichales bacterium]